MPNANPEQQQTIKLYAEALANLGKATGMLERIGHDLPDIIVLFEKNETLRQFASRQDVTAEGKSRAIHTILSESLAPALVHTIIVMVESDHIRLLPDVLHSFEISQMDNNQHLIGYVESAIPLSDTRIVELEKEVSRIMGKTVHLHPQVVTTMLGGIRIQVGDMVIDGSVDNQLETFHESLLQ
jgi:F-type H+-transporting ATPase subunit delta